MRRPLRFCLVGIGGFGRAVASALESLDGVGILYGYHPDAAKARAWDPQRGTSDLAAALADPRVDAVAIASPTPFHLEHLKICLGAGKPAYVEKPLVNTVEECRRLLELCRPGSPLICTGFKQRREVTLRAMKELLKQGTLGELVSVQMEFSHGGVYHIPPQSWRGLPEMHREGPLNIRGIHLMDSIHYLFGPVESVYCHLRNVSGRMQVPDANAVLMRLAGGASLFLQANYCVPSEDRMVLTGTEGIIYRDRQHLLLRLGRDVDRVPSSPQPVELPPAVDTTREVLAEFCAALRGETELETGLREGINATVLLEACYRSAQEDRPVRLDEYPLYRF